jgi:hypothetical protein
LKSRKIPRKIPPEYEDVPRLEKPFELGALIITMEAWAGKRFS